MEKNGGRSGSENSPNQSEGELKEDLRPSPDAGAGIPVVGVGASAGGLEALRQFFEAVPADSGVAYCVVTHQHADAVTLLPEILAKHAAISVVGIQDGQLIEPNTIYVALPGKLVRLTGQKFETEPVDREQLQFPIDHFFRSLATSRAERSVAIVLSGTGSDGSLGIVQVKAAGGLVLAQDLESAKFAGMPTSAAATRLVDWVLPASEMPGEILRYLRAGSSEVRFIRDDERNNALHRVLQILRSRSGHDFTAYKKSTLFRRVDRRVRLRHLEDIREYAKVLQEEPKEVDVLFRELLISVTSFFRDPEVFESLRPELQTLIEGRDAGQPLRIWVPACATGEEAYSLAILILEIQFEIGSALPIQIFATDLDPHAVDVARAGRYPSGIQADVGHARLERFFHREDGTYRVNSEIRELVIFAAQNVTRDPPFTRLDLLSCRNLLIYLESELQRRVIGLFSYALRPGGLLLLGNSESIAGFDTVFETRDKSAKLFRRRETRVEAPPEFPVISGRKAMEPSRRRDSPRRHEPQQQLMHAAEQALIASLVPPSVIVTNRGDIVYFHGRTGQFLEPAPGEPGASLFSMLREGLRLEVPAALRQAETSKQIIRPALSVKTNGGFSRVRLSVRRLDAPELLQGMFLISFEIEADVLPSLKTPDRGEAPEPSLIADVERQLQHTRENLQGTIEELETSNEELKSTNEELQSTNEELQSANEELETSREEMQSLNEELHTVNAELEDRNEALLQTNNDMQNLLNSTEIATIFLDAKLAIKRFTTQACKVFSLIDADIGRPISDLSSNLRHEGFVEDAEEVLRSFAYKEREIQTKEGAWRLMRIMPYRVAENAIDGLVMTFIDIDRVKREEQAAAEARRFVEDIMSALPEGVAVLDAELRIVRANPAFFQMLHTTPRQSLDQAIVGSIDCLIDAPVLIEQLPRVLSEGHEVRNLRIRHELHRLGARVLLVSARPLASTMILLTIEDITDLQS